MRETTDCDIDGRGCAVMVCHGKQSFDIAQGVAEGAGIDLGQGLMFGYACDETAEPCRPGWLKGARFLLNPTGRFLIGGPQGDCRLSGRKIIVDTCGGAC